MINCGLCHKTTAPGEKVVRVVTETRAASYPYRSKAHRQRVNGKTIVSDDPGGKGVEIAKEVLAHSGCVAR